jgi:(1->4)-alpha-D-glucan 1-alpha-D-glucosylmutase
LRAGVDLSRAREIVPYLRSLGVTELYASPIFKARAGSTHGYDVTDPTRIEPELGGEEELDRLTRELEAGGMGLILDIVPNHMAAAPENPFFRDVLEKGRRSPYAPFFDIDWREEKTFLPILGEPLSEAIAKGQITLELGEKGLAVRYGETVLPLDPASYRELLAHTSDRLEDGLAEDDPLRGQFLRLLDRIEALPSHTDTQAPGTPGARREEIKRRLLALYRSREAMRELLDETIRQFNDTEQNPGLLEDLLEAQAYRLAFWREAVRRLNYRRFFNISDLIGVRVEDPEVFQATHALILRLLRQGRLTGLRIDHIDGLLDPHEYLHRLRESAATGERAYLLVEKILARGEEIPEDWPVEGTTGYDFVNAAGGVLVEPKGLETLRARYADWTGEREPFREIVYREKKRIARTRLAPEASSLARELVSLAPEALSAESALGAIVELTACFPVYRTYVRSRIVSERDRSFLAAALREARVRAGAELVAALELLGRVLALDFPGSLAPEAQDAWLRFALRFQQFTGPAMAKGLEDTACYLYNPLLSLNEVGGHGEALTAEDFHSFARSRAARWPGSLNATSTHDTKRSEDVRARIAVLSEIPEVWAEHFERWSDWNRPHRRQVKGGLAPDESEEVLLYQTLLGAWPLSEEVPPFRRRLRRFLVKAVREGKRHSRWSDPDTEYEDAVTGFAETILSAPENRFLADFLRLQRRVAASGALNSLSQTLLKVAAPGVPDIYQGSELWDFSMVDPDNRRPVDFERNRTLLAELDRLAAQNLPELLAELRRNWPDGRIKLWLLSRALRFRRERASLFAGGQYAPVGAEGERKDDLLAFTRRDGSLWALAVVARFPTRLTAAEGPFGQLDFGQTRLLLPQEAPRRWRNVLTEEAVEAEEGATLSLSRLFLNFPVAFLEGMREGP